MLVKNFKNVRQFLDHNLVSKKYANQIEKLTALLPKVSISGIECRMENQSDRVDFSILAWTKEEIDTISRLYWNSRKANPLYWHEIRKICNKISDKDSYLNSFTKSVAMEFDLDGLSDLNEINDPLFFVLFKPMPGMPEIRSTLLLKLADEISNAYSESVTQNLKKCSESLRTDRHIYGVGWMPSRTSSSVRFGVEIRSFTEMTDYLKAIVWTGDTTQLLNAFKPYLRYFTSNIVLGIDVSEDLEERIGIEIRIDNGKNGNPILEEFLSTCLLHGIITSEKMQALLDWIGKEDKEISNQANKTPYIERGIAYFKFVYRPSYPLRLKSYLSF